MQLTIKVISDTAPETGPLVVIWLTIAISIRRANPKLRNSGNMTPHASLYQSSTWSPHIRLVPAAVLIVAAVVVVTFIMAWRPTPVAEISELVIDSMMEWVVRWIDRKQVLTRCNLVFTRWNFCQSCSNVYQRRATRWPLEMKLGNSQESVQVTLVEAGV